MEIGSELHVDTTHLEVAAPGAGTRPGASQRAGSVPPPPPPPRLTGDSHVGNNAQHVSSASSWFNLPPLPWFSAKPAKPALPAKPSYVASPGFTVFGIHFGGSIIADNGGGIIANHGGG